jgi:hypothetical protein
MFWPRSRLLEAMTCKIIATKRGTETAIRVMATPGDGDTELLDLRERPASLQQLAADVLLEQSRQNSESLRMLEETLREPIVRPLQPLMAVASADLDFGDHARKYDPFRHARRRCPSVPNFQQALGWCVDLLESSHANVVMVRPCAMLLGESV